MRCTQDAMALIVSRFDGMKALQHVWGAEVAGVNAFVFRECDLTLTKRDSCKSVILYIHYGNAAWLASRGRKYYVRDEKHQKTVIVFPAEGTLERRLEGT